MRTRSLSLRPDVVRFEHALLCIVVLSSLSCRSSPSAARSDPSSDASTIATTAAVASAPDASPLEKKATITVVTGPFDAASLGPAECPPAPTCAPADIASIASVSLERTECYGTCPEYTVTVKRDGTVTWSGTDFVQAKGARTGKANAAATRALFELIAKSCFRSMGDSYVLAVSDQPSANVSVTFASDETKTVHHYGPEFPNCAVPPMLSEIEHRIDAVAGTDKWIGRPTTKMRR
jgi:hypothetical protein